MKIQLMTSKCKSRLGSTDFPYMMIFKQVLSFRTRNGKIYLPFPN